MNTQARIIDAYENGKMVNCRWPGSGQSMLGIERKQIDEAMTIWSAMPEHVRDQRMASVRREMKRGSKRLHRGTASQAEVDNFAADVALWLAHELVFGDGERWLVKGPSANDVKEIFETGSVLSRTRTEEA